MGHRGPPDLLHRGRVIPALGPVQALLRVMVVPVAMVPDLVDQGLVQAPLGGMVVRVVSAQDPVDRWGMVQVRQGLAHPAAMATMVQVRSDRGPHRVTDLQPVLGAMALAMVGQPLGLVGLVANLVLGASIRCG